MKEFVEGIGLEKSTQTEKKFKANGKELLMSTFADTLAYFKEYCDSSGLHGVRYLSEDHRNFLEKLFWFTALTLCAVGCSFMIVKVKEKLDRTPVIVTFAESATNIWHLPFPAVTICPLTKSRQTVFNFTKYANLIRDRVDLYEDYQQWVVAILSRMSTNMYHDEYLEDYQDDNSTWIKEKFKYDVIHHLYGDFMSEELMSLLAQLFALIKSDSLFFSDSDNLDNGAWFRQKLDNWAESADIKNSIDEYYPKWLHEVYQKLRALHTVCKAEYGYWAPIFGDNYTVSTILEEGTLDFLLKVAPTMSIDDYTSHMVHWNGGTSTLDHYFQHMWTEEGVCFTFNMMDNEQIYNDVIVSQTRSSNSFKLSKDWNPDTGYSPKARRDSYPRRPLGVGKEAGLVLEMSEITEDIDYLCHEDGKSGYKFVAQLRESCVEVSLRLMSAIRQANLETVTEDTQFKPRERLCVCVEQNVRYNQLPIILHRPEDQPQSHLNFVVDVPFMTDVSISVNPTVMTTSPGLEKYEPQKRQCYFSYENHLEYFKFYSKNNCELECLAKATLQMCGCVSFYMPRNASTKLCGKESAACVYDAAKGIETREIDEDLEEHSRSEGGTFNSAISKTVCDCLPSCVSITYEADVTMVDLDIKKFLEASQAEKYYDFEKERIYSNIGVFFKNKHFIASRRSEMYGQIDFLANCGGLLGLFCGFSIISLIEFVYFLTLRLWSNIYRRWATGRKPQEKSSTA